MGCGLVGLHMKSGLTGTSFTVGRNWPPLGWAVLAGSARPQSIRTEKLDKEFIPSGNIHRAQEQEWVKVNPEHPLPV